MVDNELGTTVERIARRYAALCWWAELDDLRQEGWVAALSAKRTWNPRRGVPFAGYAGRAVALTLRNYLWACRSPVKGRTNHGDTLDGIRAVSDNVLIGVEAPRELPEVELWWRDVRAMMRTLIREDMMGGRGGEIAAMVLLGGCEYHEVSERTGIPLKRVKQFTAAARQRLRTDWRLRTLVAEC